MTDFGWGIFAGIIGWAAAVTFVAFWPRLDQWRFSLRRDNESTSPLLIYGSGKVGGLLLEGLKRYRPYEAYPVGFIDDNKPVGFNQSGIKVLGTYKDLRAIVEREKVKEIIIAMTFSDDDLESRVKADLNEAGLDKVLVRTFPRGIHDPATLEQLETECKMNRSRDKA